MAETLLEVKNLNLVFNIDIYRSFTLRDVFVSCISGPHKVFKASRKKLHVLKNINLVVRRGDRLGIVGMNGCGKTTLCRTIARMYVPDTGSVKCYGKLRSIFDTSIGIQPELTGRENAMLLGKLIFPRETNLPQLVEEAIEFSELGEFIDIPYRNYSKGMQARLCLSVISARPNDLLILDEVFDGADQYFSAKITTRMLEMMKNSASALFVSHNPEQLRSSCNRLVVMEHGSIVFDGAVEQGLDLYAQILVTHSTALQ